MIALRFVRPALAGLALLGLAALSPAQAQTLYVANNGNSTISAFDPNGTGGYAYNAAKSITSHLDVPYGLAFDTSGNLYAANFGTGNGNGSGIANTISEFNAAGVFQKTIGSSSNLNRPVDLAFDSLGNLYAANFASNANTISEFNPTTGAFLKSITGGLNGPDGLAFDTSGNLYAANDGDSTISEFNRSGGFVKSISGGGLNGPEGLAFDRSGNLYAANFANVSGGNNISEFDSNGVFQKTIGSSANLDGPIGLAFDSLGNLYAANNIANNISEFDSNGVFQKSIGSSANLSNPTFLAFSPPAPSAAPEASSVAGVSLLVLGLGGLLLRARKRKMAE